MSPLIKKRIYEKLQTLVLFIVSYYKLTITPKGGLQIRPLTDPPLGGQNPQKPPVFEAVTTKRYYNFSFVISLKLDKFA
jgi:hypothetical protein